MKIDNVECNIVNFIGHCGHNTQLFEFANCFASRCGVFTPRSKTGKLDESAFVNVPVPAKISDIIGLIPEPSLG